MEFWGVEVKGREPCKVKPKDGKLLHLSKATLGEVKKVKGNNSVPIFLNINGQKLVLGTLSPDTCTDISFDLVFEKEFELSHNWKYGSIYFCGYQGVLEVPSDDESDENSDSEDEFLDNVIENGKLEPKKEQSSLTAGKNAAAKPESSAVNPNVKPVYAKKDHSSDGDDDEDDDSEDDDKYSDSSEDEESDSFNQLMSSENGSSEEEDESSDEDDKPTPKKAEPSKKRPAVATPSKSEKRAKLVTPEKTGGDSKKVNVHVATPYPAKQAGKAVASSDKSKQQTPKSAGQISCKSCSKTFNSEAAVQSHTKAKHSGGK